MKNLLLMLITITTVWANTLTPVSHVDDKKFSGLWYEIARTANSFQENCVASSVEYQFVEPLNYKVFNRCFQNEIGGKLTEYKGTVQSTDGKSMASMKMTYFWVFSENYQVYYLDEAYQYAVVANKTFEQVWIMSRKPTMPKNVLSDIKEKLSTAMDIQKLVYTPQDKKGRYK